MPKEIIIDENYEGVSPKSFLKRKIDLPYQNIVKHIKDKRITLNGKKIKDDIKLKKNDVIKIWLDTIKLREEKIKPKRKEKNLNIENIFENEDFIILNKPPFVVVQGAQENDLSLSYHLEYLKNKNNDKSDFDYFHTHRIDKETSGILIVAKNIHSLRNLNKIFREKEIIKKYKCLCLGRFKEKKGKVEIYLKRNEQEIREKVSVCKKNDENGRYSLSYYNVLEEIEFNNEIYSLVEVEIKTGLTHQIRVHMKYLGHPIISDKMYGNSATNKEFENILDRQFLHSSYIEFPYKEKRYSFNAEFTEDLKKTIKTIKLKK